MRTLKNTLKTLIGKIPATFLERILPYSLLRQEFSAIRRTRLYPKREQLWEELFSAYLKDGPVCVLEFGVWQGYSLDYFSRLNRHPDSLFFGFDSFEGLPEDWVPGYPKGFFSTGGALPKLEDPRVQFVKGWFNRSLPPFMESQADLLASIDRGNRRLLVHFDADLFSSTLYLLATLAPRFEGYYFVFDEFTGEEGRALYHAAKAFGLEYEFYGHTLVQNGAYPWQVSGKITKSS